MDEQTRKLRSKSKLLGPKLIIGKNGITDETIRIIKELLKREKLLKIKLLKTFLDEGNHDRRELAKMLAEKTGSVLVDQVGFMVVLAKK